MKESPLVSHRTSLDRIDRIIVRALSKRFQYSLEIAQLKKQFGLDIRSLTREQEVIDHIDSLAKQLNLDPAIAIDIYHRIIQLSVASQQQKNCQ